MKTKNLKKKIRRLEKRLQQGPKKLAKLKQRLQAAETAKKVKAAKKSAARAARAAAKSSKRAEPTRPAAGKKAKKKLNLSPERRAQLAAAMKARWAAKRAADANAKASSGDNQHSAPPGPIPPMPENRPDGV
jgi:hypothetical protein